MNDTTSIDEQKITTLAISTPQKKRGFAALDRQRVRELARRGGVAAHRAGTAHEFTSDEARAAGRKGGLASQANRALSSPNPTLSVAK
jgi:uncharacterized protein